VTARGQSAALRPGIERKSPEELAIMRRAGRILAVVLDELCRAAKPGVTTGDLDRLAAEAIDALGAEAAFLGYRGYPASICTSVNDEVVHGIPGDRRLLPGDVLSIDAGVRLEDFYVDAAVTVGLAPVSADAQRLITVTRAALEAGIAQAVAGRQIADISRAVQAHADAAGISVIRDLVGHGVGRAMHEEPQVPNFVADADPVSLEPGMTLAIEPMFSLGDWRLHQDADGWTLRTADSSLAAHFEHTVAITDGAPEVLTGGGSLGRTGTT